MPQLANWANETPSTSPSLENMARIRAALRHFVTGGKVDNCKFMKRLKREPLHIFAIRIRDTDPQFRIFGAFYRPNEFVCTNWKPREDLDFAAAKKRAADRWFELFRGYPRFRAPLFTDYITENGVHDDWDCES